MALELKNISTNKALSEETICYSAKLYWKGQHIAHVGNRGCGGPDEQTPMPGKRALLDEAEAYAKSLPAIPSGFEGLPELKMDLELWCSLRVSDEMDNKAVLSMLRRDMKKSVLVVKDGGISTFSWKGVKQVEQKHIDAIKAKHPTLQILNGMPEAAALAIYKPLVLQQPA